MKKYKVVIVGAGNIGALFDQADSEEILTHAHAFSADSRFALKGFFDADFERAKVAAERWQVTAFQTLDAAMEGTDIVCCTVPDKFHFDVLNSGISNQIGIYREAIYQDDCTGRGDCKTLSGKTNSNPFKLYKKVCNGIDPIKRKNRRVWFFFTWNRLLWKRNFT